ncbi:MAG: G1 family glutamic endopeptidase [Terriglobales bacterium]
MKKFVVTVTILMLVVSLASLALAESDDLRAVRASAAMEDTNVKGVRIAVGPPAGFDALKATDRELAMYGLPPRPDQASAPKEFMLWQRAMGAAKHRASGKLDVKSFSSTNFKPSKLSATQTSNGSYNWSGVASVNTNKKWKAKTSFEEVVSIFNVPVAQPPFGACGNGITGPFYEVSWNGIGGFFSYDSLVQGGSLSAADCSGDTLYEAWVEWFPSYSIIGVFYVNPGDDIYVVSFGYPGTDEQLVFVEDITLLTYAEVELPYVTGPGLVGASAEYIVERPCCDGDGYPLPLANTIYDFFNDDVAFDSVKAFYPGTQAATNHNISMVDDTDSQYIEGVYDGATGEQGLESLWFYTEGCALSGGCTPD